jgi:signal transduction histidine kinase
MTEGSENIVAILAKLIEPRERVAAAQQLAAALSAEASLVFIRDQEVDVLLPAPGFPQTLPDGRGWQSFLQHCVNEGVGCGAVSWPHAGSQTRAIGVCAGRDIALVLVGGEPTETSARQLRGYLPLVAGALRGESAAAHYGSQARLSQELAQQARELAGHLDRARRDAQEEVVARKRAEEEVRQLNQTLERRVQDRTQSLRQAVAQMEEFSYSVSHDLRAPLRAIQGFAQVLVQDYAEKLGQEGLAFVQKILAAGSRLDRLTQDVLTYTRVTREGVELTNVDLDKLVPALVEEYGVLNRGAHICIEHPLPSVVGHEALLAQCLSNLIGNAIKFTRPGVEPHIRVWTEVNHAATRIFVSDNGIGVALGDQSRIFELFERIDRSQPGTGLGLAIVRKAAERMGGAIGLTSVPGHGSTFWIQLPLAKNEDRRPPTPAH